MVSFRLTPPRLDGTINTSERKKKNVQFYSVEMLVTLNETRYHNNLVPRVSLLPAPARERETLGEPGHVIAHDKLLPSRGILAQLFYSLEFQAGAILSKQNARDLAQFHAVCKNRILSTI